MVTRDHLSWLAAIMIVRKSERTLPLRLSVRAYAMAIFATVCGTLGVFAPQQVSAGKRSLTVSDSIEAARILSFVGDVEDLTAEAVSISPDKMRYVLVLIRADLARNGSWIDFLWGATDPVGIKQAPHVVKRLFTTDHRRNTLRTNRIVWLDDHETVAFLWSDGRSPPQVMTLRLSTGEMVPRTRHPIGVTIFDIGRGGKPIIFAAPGSANEEESREMLRNGFVVPDQALLFDIVQGRVDGRSPHWYPEVYVDDGDGARKVELSSRGNVQGTWLHLAPDGRHAVVVAPPRQLPRQWSKYTDPYFIAQFQAARDNPMEPSRLVQYYVVDMANATAQPLWNAPTAFGASGNLKWSPNSRHLLVGPTYLPVDGSSQAGLAGTAFARVDSLTGKFAEVAYDSVRPAQISRANGNSKIRIGFRETPNSPPELVATNTDDGSTHVLLDLNPWLRTDVTLGRVQVFKWVDLAGYAWTGKLFYPVNYDERRRFPLVIQLSGTVRVNEFSLGGDELISTAFAAQPLANRDIAVLQMGDPDKDAIAQFLATPREYEIVLSGINAAISSLDAIGLVDASKVGLVGFSRTGGWVEYAITHSSRKYAAAIVADNQNSSYLQYLTLPAPVKAEYERTNGAAPFGEGLQAWYQRAPGFNADKVRTPLRMEVDQHGVFGILQAWELYSQLRRLKKPVEMYVVPQSTEGEHGLENPLQIQASMQGTVDWMEFWLIGGKHSDLLTDPSSSRWNKLRRLHETDELAEQKRLRLSHSISSEK